LLDATVQPPSAIRVGGLTGMGCIVFSISGRATSLREVETASNRDVALLRSLRKPAQLLALALTIATLAACAQAPVTSSRSDLSAGGRYASQPTPQKRNPLAFAATMPAPREAAAPAVRSDAKVGMASFYTEGSRTASGERLNPAELTAAHPSLPFGTRVRVTSIDTGRSVIVRVNDRGPFVKGRALDVSYSAAKQLDMTQRGVAKVKMEVVQ
jgi:rare lipoprotein A